MESAEFTIACGALTQVGTCIARKAQGCRKILLVIDSGVPTVWETTVQQSLLAAGFEVETTHTPAGESVKDLRVIQRLWSEMMRAGITRDDVICSLGGGATSDAVGFAAATYLRGVRVIYVPTTLLAMVDASIGGKCGINFACDAVIDKDATSVTGNATRTIKNVVGVFAQPLSVIIDPRVIQTLDVATYSSGLAEAAKTCILAGGDALHTLEDNIEKLSTRDEQSLEALIRFCCAFKTDIVRQDFKETNGIRTALNYGHTFAHAIESVSGEKISHGYAVALGMRFAARISMQCAHSEASRASAQAFCAWQDALLDALALPHFSKQWCACLIGCEDAFLQAMRHDKKNTHEGVRFVLVDEPGAWHTALVNECDICAVVNVVLSEVADESREYE